MTAPLVCPSFFFFNDTATTEIYTLSLHDALPISSRSMRLAHSPTRRVSSPSCWAAPGAIEASWARSEEHTSELQSQSNLVCRLLLEKKKRQHIKPTRRRPLLLPAAPRRARPRTAA